MDSYHLQCIGLTAKDTGLGDYKCSYCEILKGKSQYSNGSSLLRFEKHIELNILVKLLSDAEHLCFGIDERDLLNQLIEKGFACKSALREIVNLSSAYASKVAGVYDQGGNCDLELALARYLWKSQVNILLSSEQKPTVEQIQKHLKEGMSMEISPKDHYMLKLTNVNCLGLHWVELAKK
ncbi:lysine-specific demethylase 5D, partial [Trifolium pratense]